MELKYPAVEWQFLITRGTRVLSRTFIASIHSGDSLTIRFKRPAVTQIGDFGDPGVPAGG